MSEFLTPEEFKTLIKPDYPQHLIDEIWDANKTIPLTFGSSGYYFKPKTKTDPARIYVFMHHQRWQDRNKRQFGLQGHFPFKVRRMTRLEIIDEHLNFREVCYYYESWNRLIQMERDVGTDEEFIQELETFRDEYKLSEPKVFSEKELEDPFINKLNQLQKIN